MFELSNWLRPGRRTNVRGELEALQHELARSWSISSNRRSQELVQPDKAQVRLKVGRVGPTGPEQDHPWTRLRLAWPANTPDSSPQGIGTSPSVKRTVK